VATDLMAGNSIEMQAECPPKEVMVTSLPAMHPIADPMADLIEAQRGVDAYLKGGLDGP
jgi:hypothetical protein